MASPTYKYPGLNLPLRHIKQNATRYAVGIPGQSGAETIPIFVRESAMMMIMEKLTDKQDWHLKVFDQMIVDKWREEALAIPDEEWWTQITEGNGPNGYAPVGLITTPIFDYCIEELREKAVYFSETGIVPGLDLSASIAKSDILVDHALQLELQSAVKRLKESQASSPDWHPGSNDTVQDLVHPSLYPLVYGKSKVHKEEVVGVEDAIEGWTGKGEIIPTDNEGDTSNSYGWQSQYPEFWSDTFQWLPSNVAFQDDGSVRFTSYINNLHPKKHSDMYKTLEKLIAKAIPLWEQCLVPSNENGTRFPDCPGHRAPRIPLSENPDDENELNWIPSRMSEVENLEVDPKKLEEYDWIDDKLEQKWLFLRKARHPEPSSFQPRSYTVIDDLRLAKKFRESGLQIIVKIVSIELTPETPEFKAGSWHVEGQMNERICATALYYLDSENITESSLSFRMRTPEYIQDESGFMVGQDSYQWLQYVYGVLLSGPSSNVQNFGSVTTNEGRLLAFPNTFQHAVSPFELQDKTKPGHRRFVALWLVDPHVRILSTANVPPQQQSWWLESILGTTPTERAKAAEKLPVEVLRLLRETAGAGSDDKVLSGNCGQAKTAALPEELVAMILSHFSTEGLMTEAEAHDFRLKLMDERTQFQGSDKWYGNGYNFCEH